MKTAFGVCESPVRPQCHGGDTHLRLSLNRGQGGEGIFDTRPAGGKFSARYQIVNLRQDAFETGIDGIDVNSDRDAVGAGDSRGVLNRRRIVAVNVQETRTGDLIGRDLRGRDLEAIRTVPEDRSFAGRFVNRDIGRLIRTVHPLLDMLDIDAGSAQAVQLEAAAVVIPDSADVLRPQTEVCACDHGSSDLSAGGKKFPRERSLAAICGEPRHNQHSIRGIEPDANYIEIWHPYSIVARTAPAFTLSFSLTSMAVTRPPRGAFNSFCIFMASTMTIPCPATTSSPTAT